nr:GNAT family N-acetyltransferase [Clostridium tagluense]
MHPISHILESDHNIYLLHGRDSDLNLDRLFIHKDYQGKGIATAITTELEAYGFKNNLNLILTHAFITAKPFFEKCGYHVLKKQVVERSGQRLTNFVMQN